MNNDHEEQTCANCIHYEYDEEIDLYKCSNKLQTYVYVTADEYCFRHELNKEDNE